MAKVTDEMLMAYADGALNALARAKVEAVLQGDPEARRRLEFFRETGKAALSKLYDRPMTEPVPERLKEFVLNYRAPVRVSKVRLVRERLGKLGGAISPKARVVADGVVRWLTAPGPQPVRWQLAAASAAILAVGASAGIFLSSGENFDGLVSYKDGHIFANGGLKNVLEKEPSRQEVRIGGVRGEAVTMRATLTFRNRQQTYCREYEIETPRDGSFAGLGCRDRDGNWALQVHVPTKAPGGGTQPVGVIPLPALDGIVEQSQTGDVFGRDEEAAAIGSGWK